MHHILRCLEHARGSGATRIEVTPQANSRYFQRMLERRRHQVFFQDSCSSANSYYFDVNGDVPFRPASTLETIWASRQFPLADYMFETIDHRVPCGADSPEPRRDVPSRGELE